MARLLLLLVVLNLFISCKEKGSFKLFKTNIELSEKSGERIGNFIFKRPLNIKILDSFLVVFDSKNPKGILHFFEKKKLKYIKSFGQLGKGPDEFISPAMFKIRETDRTIWLIDAEKSELYGFFINDILYRDTISKFNRLVFKIPPFSADSFGINDFAWVNDSIIALSGSISNLISFYNVRSSKFLNDQGALLIKNEHKKNRLGFRSLSSHLIVRKPQNNVFAAVYIYYDALTINDRGHDLTTRIGPDGIKPKIRYSKKNHGAFIHTVDTKYAYRSLTSDSDLIYGLYENGPGAVISKDKSNAIFLYPRYINIFNWQGIPLAQIHFQKGIFNFAIDSETNRLITIDAESDNAGFVIYPFNKRKILPF